MSTANETPVFPSAPLISRKSDVSGATFANLSKVLAPPTDALAELTSLDELSFSTNIRKQIKSDRTALVVYCSGSIRSDALFLVRLARKRVSVCPQITMSDTGSPRGARPGAGGTQLRQRKTTAAAAGTRARAGGNNGGLWKFYTEDSTGLKIGPVPVLVMSLVFIASVFVLHIWGKYTRSRA